MLTLNETVPVWKRLMRQNITRCDELADFLHLDQSNREKLLKAPKFSLNLPLRLAKKIPKNTLDDPVLKQFIPLLEEKKEAAQFVLDPVGHLSCRKEAKLIHKYQGRALLTCTSACAMHCRYCYRQHFPYDCADKTFNQEIALIEQDPSIHEIILSGGDPLSLDDTILAMLLNKLELIPHIKRIRFHSRFPIGIPERISSDFLSMLEGMKPSLWFVIHCNHPRELDEDVLDRLALLRERGVMLLNQSVLLKGVNDDSDTLASLCENLVDHGIIPYYLHQLDRVQGAAHFEVPIREGLKIMKELTYLLPGYAVPKYVQEVPGKAYKEILHSLDSLNS